MCLAIREYPKRLADFSPRSRFHRFLNIFYPLFLCLSWLPPRRVKVMTSRVAKEPHRLQAVTPPPPAIGISRERGTTENGWQKTEILLCMFLRQGI